MSSPQKQNLIGGLVYAIGAFLLLHAFISCSFLFKYGREWMLLHDGGSLMLTMELLNVGGIISSFILMLKGNKGSITSIRGLRTLLTWFILYEIFEMFFISTPLRTVFRLLMVVFLLISLRRLKKVISRCKEEGIEEEKNSQLKLLPERIFFIGSLILLVSFGGSIIGKSIRALPYLPNTISLEKEELTTGAANFTPLDGWQLDSTLHIGDVLEHIFIDRDSVEWYITSFPAVFNDRRNHNKLISIASPAFQDGQLIHLYSLDTLITDDLILRSDSFYGYEKEDTSAFSFAVLYSKKSQRNLIIARIANDHTKKEDEDLMALIGGVRFDLTGKKKFR